MKKLLFSLALMLFAGMSFGQLKVVSNGNTGVGLAFTTGGQSPAQQLHVDGNLQVEKANYAGIFLRTSGATASAQMRFRSNFISSFSFDDVTGSPRANVQYNANLNVLAFQNSNAGAITYWTNNQILYWAPTGRLGIGTNAPTKNLHVIGNAGKTDGTSTWDIISDKRLKTNIKTFEGGLDEIMKINPITFEYTGEFGTVGGKEVVGVIAQDIKKVAPYMVSKETLTEIENSKNRSVRMVDGKEVIDENFEAKTVRSEEFLTMNNDAFTYMLINSIQEQQAMIEAQNDQINELKTQMANIQTAAGTTTHSIDLTDVKLEQNAPNPFNESTVISYTVPSKSNTAFLQIYDLNGQLIKSVNVAKGNGQLTINAGELAAGTYSYNLVVDGAVAASRKMILTK